MLIVDGDLRITGDLDLFKMESKPSVLVVQVVDGAYHDHDDPEQFMFVTGAMTARDVLTAGWLEVHGELTAGVVIGDYNHGGAHLGSLRARVLYPEEHPGRHWRPTQVAAAMRATAPAI